MKKTPLPALAAVVLVSMSILGCGILTPVRFTASLPSIATSTPFSTTSSSPTPTPAAFKPRYTNDATGLSIWYPDDWAYEEFVEEVIFASTEEIIQGAELESGAAMMLARDELQGRETLEDLVETTLGDLSFEDVKTSDRKPHKIGGRPGIVITLEGTPQGADVSMRGFLAAVEHNGWGYLFVAATMLDEWSEYGPLLEAMLRSVRFRDTEPIYTNAALGLSVTYPDGWVYEEQGEQVIFGTSPETISGAELETGAVMFVTGTPLTEFPTIEEMVEMMLSELPFDDMKTRDMGPHTIGGQEAMMISFGGTPDGEDTSVRGFLAGAEYDGWGYLFVGFSMEDEWCDYEPVLETMLDSVQFTKRQLECKRNLTPARWTSYVKMELVLSVPILSPSRGRTTRKSSVSGLIISPSTAR